MLNASQFNKEALEIVRVISLYKVLQISQIVRLFPEKNENVVQTIICRLCKSGRLFHDTTGDYLKASEDEQPDKSIIAAFWVLLDFIQDVSFHTVSDFPVTISFFVENELFEIITVTYGNENHVNYAVGAATEEPSKAIVLVESPDQINSLKIPNVAAYCIVSESGGITYFKAVNEALLE